MREIYWIDGYNLLFYLDQAEKLESARDKLLKILNEMVSRAGVEAIVVFDGAQDFTRTNFDCLQVIYTPAGQTADDYILDDIESTRAKGHLFIVTNDRRLATLASSLNVKNIKLPMFFQTLTKKREKKKRVKKETTATVAPIKIVDREFERFLKIFEERFEKIENDEDLQET